MYDGRIGRWLSVDPMGQYSSPYEGMGNNPVVGSDPSGGYSWFGALWRQTASFLGGNDPSAIYKSGDEYGFNASGLSYFGPSKYGHDSNNWFSNRLSAIGMTTDWILGTGQYNRTFNNDAAARALRNSRVVAQARDFWYQQVNSGNKTIYDGVSNFSGRQAWTGGNFGAKGLVKAGIDPIE